jgi:Flp pilus assembly secretin CpaC
VSLTSGWLSALDLKEVHAVTSTDETIVIGSTVDPGQVLLLGLQPGVATVSVWTGTGQARRRTDFEVTVSRFATLQPWNGMLQVDADQPRTLEVPSLTRVAVGDASTCEAIASGPDELELIPRRAGTTSVLVWTGGPGGAHRRQLLVTVVSGGVVRSVDDSDAVLTEPLDGRLVLISGERQAIDIPSLTHFAVLDATVAQVHLGGRGELIVEGKAAGATRVLAWMTGKSRPESHFVVVHARTRCDPEEAPEPPLPPHPLPVSRNL